MAHNNFESRVTVEATVITRTAAVELLENLKQKTSALVPRKRFNPDMQKGLLFNCKDIQQKIESVRAVDSPCVQGAELSSIMTFVDAYGRSLKSNRTIHKPAMF